MEPGIYNHIIWKRKHFSCCSKSRFLTLPVGVHVDHDVFDFGEGLLDRPVDLLGDRVGLGERERGITADLNIHIDAVGKHAGLDAVDSEHLRHRGGTVAQGQFHLLAAGVINHLGDGVAAGLRCRARMLRR